MTRKIIFWLGQNECMVSADEVPGAIADAIYPRPLNETGRSDEVFDPNKIPRLKEERRQSKLLRAKFPSLPDDYSFCLDDLNNYLARMGLVAEVRHRHNTSEMQLLGPEGRWAERQFIDGFNSVHASITPARKLPANPSAERCAELATTPSLKLSAFIELVGIGIGMHGSYYVSSEGIAFRKWEEDFIAEWPIDWQAEMNRDNEASPTLTFPCTPAELLQFVDTAIGIHYFSVPDAFRQAVKFASEKSESTTSTTAKPLPAQRFQEQEILRVISELGHAPTALPKDIPGKPGVKAEVRKRLSIFSTGVFDKAWGRLSSTKEIVKST
jgi:hypothetical protein